MCAIICLQFQDEPDTVASTNPFAHALEENQVNCSLRQKMTNRPSFSRNLVSSPPSFAGHVVVVDLDVELSHGVPVSLLIQKEIFSSIIEFFYRTSIAST